MPLYLFSGYAPSDFQTIQGSTPGSQASKMLRVPDDTTHAFEVNDDDGMLSGSGGSVRTAGDTNQKASVYQGNAAAASGTVYVQSVMSFEDQAGTPHKAYLVGIEESGERFYVFEAPPPAGGTDLTVISSSPPPSEGVAYSALAGNDIRDSDARPATDASGNEYIASGSGDDALTTRGGNDTVDAGEGNDTVTAGDGDDSIEGGAGNDSLDGGAGNDTLSGGAGNDTLHGDAGNDQIDGGAGSDIIYGGEGNDTLAGNEGTDCLRGDAGNDVIFGGAGDDAATGGAGNDTLYGNDGADVLYGGDGDDFLIGDGGNGETGNDTLIGEAGDDTLFGQGGDDVMTGGSGNDFFLVSAGNDTITDFNGGNTGSIDDRDLMNNDFVNLSTYYDNLSQVRADHADDGVLNQSNTSDSHGNAVDYSDNTQFGASSLTMQGATSQSFTYDTTGLECFASDTLIDTPKGAVRAGALRPGDLVTTLDHGPQPLLWVGVRRLEGHHLRGNVRRRPVLVRQGVLGARRDLFVSRQHGLVVGDNLSRAIHLCRTMKGVRIAHGKRHVTYVHLLFERHQIVISEGVPSESFYPGPSALRTMAPEARRAVLRLLPGLDRPEATTGFAVVRAVYGPTARPFAPPRRAAAERPALDIAS